MNTDHGQAVKSLREWCRPRGIRVVSFNQYKDTRAAAEKAKIFAPSGLLIHLPRNSSSWAGGVNPKPNRIIYVVWYGEPLEKVEETIAWFLLAHPERTDRRVVCCHPYDDHDGLTIERAEHYRG